MINITSLVKQINGFNHEDFTMHQREETLLQRNYRKTSQGWFYPNGAFVGKTDEDAIEKLGLGLVYRQLNPTSFHLLERGEVPTNSIFKVIELHGVNIVGVFDE